METEDEKRVKHMADFDKLWEYNDPAGTERKFRDLLAGATGDLELLTQIARAQGLQQRFDEAHATLDDVERRMRPGDHLVRVRYLLERGRVFNSSKQRERALPLFTDAMNAAIEHGFDFYAVDAIHMLAIAEPDSAKQLAWNFKAMQFAEASTDERARGWLGSLYNNIGWTHYAQQRYAEALEVFQKTVTFFETAKRPDRLRIAHYSVGKTLRALGDLDGALAIQLVLRGDAESQNEPDGYVCEEIAECLLAQGKVDDAKNYFARAYELLSSDEWLKRDEPERLERLRNNASRADTNVKLRDVIDSDLDVFFTHETDPVAIHMAAFTAKDPNDRDAFDAQWAKIRVASDVMMKTILVDGTVAGHIASWGAPGEKELTYWIGQEFWGRSVATSALREYVKLLPSRPLTARAAVDNAASVRVLQKCGFAIVAQEKGFANARGCEIDEYVLHLTTK